MPTLMLIDGNSLTYRAFFALPSDMATASGQVTNAVFGFTSMLINLKRDHQPDLIAVADQPAGEQDQLITFLAGVFATRTRAEWEAWFADKDVAFAPVLDFREALDQ